MKGLVLSLTLLGAVASGAPADDAKVRAEGVTLDLALEGMPAVTVQAQEVEGEAGQPMTVAQPRLDVGDELQLSGERGTVDLTGEVAAEGDIRALLEAKAPLEIRAERFRIDVKQHEGHFSGAVEVTQGTLVLLCEELLVRYDEASDGVRGVVASGTVEIRQGDRLARGERAEFDRATGTVVLTGQPYLEQGKVHLRGSVIRFYVDGGEITCEGCQAVFEG